MCDLARVHMSDAREGVGVLSVGDTFCVWGESESTSESESMVGLSVCTHWASWIRAVLMTFSYVLMFHAS